MMRSSGNIYSNSSNSTSTATSNNRNTSSSSSSSIRFLTVVDILSLSLFTITSMWFLRNERRRREIEFSLPPTSQQKSSRGAPSPRRQRHSLRMSPYDESSLQQQQQQQASARNSTTGLSNDPENISSHRGNTISSSTIMGKIGSRGEAALSPPLPYLQSFARCLQDPCDPITNPSGFIGLCVAENKLVVDLLAERFMQFATTAFSDSTVYCYSSFLGLPLPREATAYFLAKRFLFPQQQMQSQSQSQQLQRQNNINNTATTTTTTTTPPTTIANNTNNDIHHILTPEEALHHINPSHVALGAGCAALLNNLFFILGEHGDACLIPAPYYVTYELDISLIADCIPFGFHMANVALGPTEKDLDLGYIEARSKGLTPRFLLLTNPNNPLGVIYKPEIIRNAIQWARKRGIQTIVDEVHALSTHKKYEHDFQSVIRVLNNQLGDDVHMVYSLSKDFGASGLRVGILYSQNDTLMEALANIQMFGCVSGPIQYVVSELLTDDHFVDQFLDESRDRIRWSYEICVQKLEEMVLPYVPAEAGLFVYVDFSSLLPPHHKSFDYETKLFTIMFEYARVVLTPGEVQCERTPGMFRICYAWVSPQVLQIAMERLSKLVAKIRRLNWDDLNSRTLAGIV